MPPHRTFPPAKPIKTERTHEENQERAYIAASRRSDRSLEARVESARRASEIHKRRTGRALRVTEEDVINEEMYEEEDDDLPSQYRRLTAHLQTGSADFNRRLAAYLTNHLVMRSALDQAVHSSYAQQFPNAPQFAHNQSLLTSPLPTGVAGLQAGMPSPALPSPHPYRQSPYPLSARPAHEGTASKQDRSTATPAILSTPTGFDTLFDPLSTMVTPGADMLPLAPDQFNLMPTPSSGAPNNTTISPSPVDAPPRAMGTIAEHVDFGPLSMALPQESQLLLGSLLDFNDPFAQQLLGVPPISSDPPAAKAQAYHPGINMTLAPSAMSLTPQQSLATATAPPSEPYDLSFDADLLNYKGVSFGTAAPPLPSALGSFDASTAETEWDSFINESSWTEGT